MGLGSTGGSGSASSLFSGRTGAIGAGSAAGGRTTRARGAPRRGRDDAEAAGAELDDTGAVVAPPRWSCSLRSDASPTIASTNHNEVRPVETDCALPSWAVAINAAPTAVNVSRAIKPSRRRLGLDHVDEIAGFRSRGRADWTRRSPCVSADVADVVAASSPRSDVAFIPIMGVHAVVVHVDHDGGQALVRQEVHRIPRGRGQSSSDGHAERAPERPHRLVSPPPVMDSRDEDATIGAACHAASWQRQDGPVVLLGADHHAPFVE